MRGLQDLRFDNRPGRVELRRRARGVDSLRDAEFGRKVARAAERDQHAAVFDELVELDHACEAHAAGDIVRFAVHAEGRKLSGFGIGERLAFRFDIEDDRLRTAAALIRNHDDIVGIAQIALAYALLIYKVVGDFEMIKGIAHPADILGAAPGAVHRQARQIDDVAWNVRHACECDGLQAPAFRSRLSTAGWTATRNEPAGSSVSPVLNGLLDGLELHILQAVAQCDQRIRSVVRARR